MILIRLFFLVFCLVSFNTLSFTQNSLNKDSLTLINQVEDVIKKAMILSSSNKLDSAALFLEQATSFSFEAKNWDYYVALLSALAANSYYQNSYEKYNIYSHKALKEAKRLLGKDHPRYIEAINNLVIYYQERGDYDRSDKYLDESLELIQKNGSNKLSLAVTYQNLAFNFELKEDYTNVLNYRKQALYENLDTLSKNDVIIGINYKDIGFAYKQLNELDSSLIYLNKGLSILRKIKKSGNNLARRNTIMILHGLSESWLLKENYKKAKKAISEVLQMQKEDNAFRKAFSYEVLAKIYKSEKKYGEALVAIKTANQLAKINYRNNSYPIRARKLLVTAEIFHLKNALDSALYYTQNALQVLAPESTLQNDYKNPSIDQLLAKSDALNIFIKKANILSEKHEINEDASLLQSAHDTYIKCVDLIRNIRQGTLSNSAKNILAEKSTEVYGNGIRTALDLYDKTNDPSHKDKAFNLAENNKALLLLETINEQFAQGKAEISDTLLDKNQELKINLAFFQKKILEEKQKQEKANLEKLNLWERNLFDLQQEHDLLISQLEEDYPNYYKLKYKNEPADINIIRDHVLTSENALIEYFLGERNIYIFCLTKNDIQIKTIPTNDLKVDDIQKLRSFVSNPPHQGMSASEIQEFKTLAYYYYKLLLRPAVDEMNQDINSLFIIPDGILAYVPFDVLLTKPYRENDLKLPNDEDYLLSKYSVSYDYSATLLVKNNNRESTSYTSDFIAYAPSFKGQVTELRDCEGTQLSQLKCNQNEVENIGTILNGQINQGQHASSTNFFNSTDQNRIIHLATHACVNDQNSMLNRVYFADDDLTLFDFYNTKLNAELVVLSACNTGVGKIQKGEGVMSIARGFMAAGSPSTMLSLWSVDDCSTSDMMGYYYKNLKAGDKKNKALQKAKLKFLETAPKAMKHPFYWGAFVQFGNVEAMEFNNTVLNSYYWVGLIFLLIILWILLYYKKLNIS